MNFVVQAPEQSFFPEASNLETFKNQQGKKGYCTQRNHYSINYLSERLGLRTENELNCRYLKIYEGDRHEAAQFDEHRQGKGHRFVNGIEYKMNDSEKDDSKGPCYDETIDQSPIEGQVRL